MTAGPDQWTALAVPNALYRYCANQQYSVCNWMVRASNRGLFCLACRLNQTIPDLDDSRRVMLWDGLRWPSTG